LEIQITVPYGHPGRISAHEPILVVRMPWVAETFKTVIDDMIHVTKFTMVSLLHTNNTNLTHEYLTTSIEQPGNLSTIHLGSYDSFISRAKPSSNGQLLHCSWSFGIFDKSHQYKMKSRVGWRIATNSRIGLKL
jgi:hypothetical protein